MRLGYISLVTALLSGKVTSSDTSFHGLFSHANDHDQVMKTSNTRGGASMQKDHMHFIRRIYGPENQKVRDEVRKLEQEKLKVRQNIYALESEVTPLFKSNT